MKYKSDDFLPFTDDFIFSRVMQDTEICKGILERILPDEEFYNIQLLSNEPDILCNSSTEIVTQKSLKFDANSHGVRFDALMKSDDLRTEIEMQTYSGEDIGKRSRYYHSNIDIDALASGQPYKELPKAYVIFICTFDYEGLGEPIYQYPRYDIFTGSQLDDNSYTILLNTTCPLDKVPEKLSSLYAYIQNPTVCGDEFIEKLDAKVREYNTPKWRRIHMTFDYLLDRQEEIGKEIGKEIGEEIATEKINRLHGALLDAGRLDDLKKAILDLEYQNQLFEEFNL